MCIGRGVLGTLVGTSLRSDITSKFHFIPWLGVLCSFSLVWFIS